MAVARSPVKPWIRAGALFYGETFISARPIVGRVGNHRAQCEPLWGPHQCSIWKCCASSQTMRHAWEVPGQHGVPRELGIISIAASAPGRWPDGHPARPPGAPRYPGHRAFTPVVAQLTEMLHSDKLFNKSFLKIRWLLTRQMLQYILRYAGQ